MNLLRFYCNNAHAWREEKVPEQEWGNMQSIINFWTLITLLKNRSNDHNLTFRVNKVMAHLCSEKNMLTTTGLPLLP